MRLVKLKDGSSTTKGCLSKGWYSDGKSIYLIKGNSNFNGVDIGYEPFSEAIASIVAKHLGLPHIDYWLAYNKYIEVKTYGIDYVSVCKADEKVNGCQRMSALKYMQTLVG